MSKRNKKTPVTSKFTKGVNLLVPNQFHFVRVDSKCLLVLQRIATEKRFANAVDNLLRKP